ncbi:hypothetical protein ZYGR_0I01370 [Zygosaccharomyces rouxii]|uniref:ZYRO0C03278p n=2 Tax=Zygosaccharomyces rouxii TaxID=4956 RepID=C5DSV4_ZYGRC|nr:uncharacterized protein ZYRO0C03278g [Zygosaccharomyces rouxii]KAH9201945.1 hypothetical protein LQ764DRAFT_233621 [Zygosaccharomyces rouxii]GAV47841.1 hypothetical protein ZYGR_0I01370 [Zygosaccharomyces rouxii]CAR26865.1 ZYRO0C03278p [Zygosaccharomyces rouxii]
MQFKKSSVAWLLLLNFAAEITSSASVTSHAVTTNIGGLPVTQTLILDHPEKRAEPAAAGAQQGAAAQQGVTDTATTAPGAIATATTGATASGSGATTTPAGATTSAGATTPATGTTTSGSALTTTPAAATTPATGTTTSGSALTTTPATATTPATTTPAAATTPATTTPATASSTSSSDTPAAKVTHQTTRPDPSTNMFTPPPSTPVTDLSMDTLATMTQMKDGKTNVYTTTKEHTSNMWVTIPYKGSSTVVQTTFAQRFASMYDKVASPKQGSVGLGSISGTIGVVKSQMKYTLSSSNGVAPQVFSDRSMFFPLVAFFMWFL